MNSIVKDTIKKINRYSNNPKHNNKTLLKHISILLNEEEKDFTKQKSLTLEKYPTYYLDCEDTFIQKPYEFSFSITEIEGDLDKKQLKLIDKLTVEHNNLDKEFKSLCSIEHRTESFNFKKVNYTRTRNEFGEIIFTGSDNKQYDLKTMFTKIDARETRVVEKQNNLFRQINNIKDNKPTKEIRILHINQSDSFRNEDNVFIPLNQENFTKVFNEINIGEDYYDDEIEIMENLLYSKAIPSSLKFLLMMNKEKYKDLETLSSNKEAEYILLKSNS